MKKLHRLCLHTSIGHASQVNETGKSLMSAKKEPPLDYWHFNAITEFRFKN